jgi:hypothetical protein
MLNIGVENLDWMVWMWMPWVGRGLDCEVEMDEEQPWREAAMFT